MDDFEIEIIKVANKALKDAQKRSLENGVPNVYSKNGQLYFQLPDGTITQEIPQMYKDLDNSLEVISKREID
jgi:RNA-splicing ligase RtcB